ncbi:hypothetical protein FIV42_24360 [Persicimonas caeni]|uniref:VWA domain-containing protein n=1 Tax=Persicimonas caeni TaxID=2292766 RepID=A0A4Y6PZL2_PERCE|nr:hypothetical protein [Persicimonas caeni]QDG53761.1 hypothetical protein FIV42_24360 [Persicimonas caeni]QED34982.1 hypothetical protein FRD00_24355 [Persicimonas caeni]
MAAACTSDNSEEGCVKDSDCKLDRICVEGSCEFLEAPNNDNPDAGGEDTDQTDSGGQQDAGQQEDTGQQDTGQQDTGQQDAGSDTSDDPQCDPAADSDGDRINDCDEVARGTDPNAADTDGDGLDDHTEIFREGTDPLDPDSDGDGLSDGDELNVHDTDPFEADTDQDGVSDGDEVDTYGSDPLQTDTDGDGLDDGAEVNDHGSDPTMTDTDGDGLDDRSEINSHASDPTMTDTDGDGLDDAAEVNTHGTNPAAVDTDGDTLEDGAEVNTHGTDPLSEDTDNDFATDADEIAAGTDPLVADGDGDGLLDGEEAQAGTDPSVADSDGDGLNDYDEVVVHSSDPLLADTDGDGLDDAEEVAYGLDPTQASTYNDGVQDANRWFVTQCTNNSGTITGAYQTQSSSAGNWALALDVDYTQFVELNDTSGSSLGAAAFGDANSEVLGFVVADTAALGADANEMLQLRRQRLTNHGTLAQDWSLGEFTTHDGFLAARGHYMLQTASAMTTGQLRDTLLAEMGPFVATDVANLPTPNGPSGTEFRVDLTVVQRTQGAIVLATVTEATTLGANPGLRALAKNAVDTTALTAASATPTNHCETFGTFTGRAPVEFYWVLDQSGSMSDDYSRLQNVYAGFFSRLPTMGFDWRMGVTAMDDAQNGQLLNSSGWHRSQTNFEAEVQQVVNWTGNRYEEFGLKVTKEGLTDMLGSQSATPIRTGAEVISIYLSDEEAQTFQNDPLTSPTGSQLMSDFVSYFGGKTIPVSLVGDGQSCGNYDAASYRQLAASIQGAYGSLCQSLEPILDHMLDLAAARATNYTLPSSPIASSLRVYVGGQAVSRSRTDGWDYFPETNSVAFFGPARPQLEDPANGVAGERVVIIYDTLSP